MEARPEPSRSVRGTRLPPEYAGLPLTVEKLPTIDLKERSPPSFDRTLFYLAAGISLSLADDRPPFNPHWRDETKRGGATIFFEF